eukprot:EC718008.1.p2 GENE.EC718008.1~~EC718008.1.p2  ORF type:complete len:56 (-),score=11.17 EC718008.1:125-292(-)
MLLEKISYCAIHAFEAVCFAIDVLEIFRARFCQELGKDNAIQERIPFRVIMSADK